MYSNNKNKWLDLHAHSIRLFIKESFYDRGPCEQ